MTTSGVVREWHDEEGWGVIDADAAPGGCWVHFSSVLVPGFHTLTAGQSVVLDVEQVEQDGYGFRATRLWPEGQEPDERTVSADGRGYRSHLHLSFDGDDDEPQTGTSSTAPTA